MARQNEMRNNGQRRNRESFGREFGQMDQGRISFDRNQENMDRDFDFHQYDRGLGKEQSSDYYNDADEERRFGREGRGFGDSGRRSGYQGGRSSRSGSDYGWDRGNDFRNQNLRAHTRFNSADEYGQNIGNGGHAGKGPKGWKRSDDRIKDEVCEALSDSHRVDASEIDVSVKDGIVSLKGTVDSREAKREAESCVEYLSGVEDVQNEIRVKRNENTNENVSNFSEKKTKLS